MTKNTHIAKVIKNSTCWIVIADIRYMNIATIFSNCITLNKAVVRNFGPAKRIQETVKHFSSFELIRLLAK